MNHTLALLTVLLLTPLSKIHAADAPAPPVKPNILWIVMDDVGAELPCYGEKKIQTPNIDRCGETVDRQEAIVKNSALMKQWAKEWK